jgi:hypothetical protein
MGITALPQDPSCSSFLQKSSVFLKIFYFFDEIISINRQKTGTLTFCQGEEDKFFNFTLTKWRS